MIKRTVTFSVLHIILPKKKKNKEMGFPGGPEVKASASNAGDLGLIPWRRKWQPTPVFLSGESHGRRSLVGYNPWGHKELDTTEQLHFIV